MVDKTLILRKLSELEQYLVQISEFSNITAEGYLKDWKIQRIIERTLQMMIETCLDVAGHIISEERYRVPESYADMFKILQENGILEETLLNTLDKMAKFRNIIVHTYDKIDPEIIILILSKNLKDFDKYQNAIIHYLKTKETQKE